MTTEQSPLSEAEPMIARKLEEIRHQLRINVEIIKRDYPDKQPAILPHEIEIITGHVTDRLNELESLIAEVRRSRTGGAELIEEAAQVADAYGMEAPNGDLIEQQARQLEEAREALSHVDCPRPINGRPDDFLATDCVKAGECGCCFRDALRFTLKEISNG